MGSKLKLERKLALEEVWMVFVRENYFKPVGPSPYDVTEKTMDTHIVFASTYIPRKPSRRKKLAVPAKKIRGKKNDFILVGKDLVAAAWKKISSKAAQNQGVV